MVNVEITITQSLYDDNFILTINGLDKPLIISAKKITIIEDVQNPQFVEDILCYD
jgi:hypothetical protein